MADDIDTSRITGAIVALATIVNVVSVPVVIAVLYVLLKYHHDGPFFALYKASYVGLVSDVATLLTQIFGMLQTRLVISEFFETEPYRKVESKENVIAFGNIFPFYAHNFAQYFLHTYQAFTNGYICLNRATAVLFPVHHHKWWERRTTLAGLLVAQFCAACMNGIQSLQLDMRVDRYSTGERFLIPLNTSSAQLVWLRTFIAMFCGDSSIIILYGFAIWKFRSKLLHAFYSRAEENEDRQAVSLLLIAVTVIAMEIFYCFFFYLSFIARINVWDDSRIWFAYYFGINCLYSSLPSYLLIVFSYTIRQQVTTVIMRDIAERQDASAKVSTISIRMTPSRRYSLP